MENHNLPPTALNKNRALPESLAFPVRRCITITSARWALDAEIKQQIEVQYSHGSSELWPQAHRSGAQVEKRILRVMKVRDQTIPQTRPSACQTQ